MKRQKGFTLIELLVVISIIGILAAIGLSSYRVANQKARDSRRQADIQAIRSSLEVFKSESNDGIYPLTSEFNDTTFGSYFSNDKIPVDPNSDASTCEYVYNSADGNSYTLSYCTELDGPFTVDNP